jgi:hypothetical protein
MLFVISDGVMFVINDGVMFAIIVVCNVSYTTKKVFELQMLMTICI